jgi:hypothetical protein
MPYRVMKQVAAALDPSKDKDKKMEMEDMLLS